MLPRYLLSKETEAVWGISISTVVSKESNMLRPPISSPLAQLLWFVLVSFESSAERMCYEPNEGVSLVCFCKFRIGAKGYNS